MTLSKEDIFSFQLGNLGSIAGQRYNMYVGIEAFDGETTYIPEDEAAIFAHKIRQLLKEFPGTPEHVIRATMLKSPAEGAEPIILEAIKRVFPTPSE